ncbi:MAG: Mur ligase domain-containing protein, partial [Pseudomonadota bacterium]|nr:Mur ligase domain-containing protein [Pseudomonadota bacterium]
MNASPATMRISAETLAERTGGNWSSQRPSVDLTSIEIDSRRCVEGSLFVALPGAHADGHDF